MNAFVIDECDVDAEMDAAIRRTLSVCFPHRAETFAEGRRWRGNIPLFNSIIVADDAVCAHVAVVDRTIRAGLTDVRVAAVGMVAVAPACRGRRLVDGALSAAMAEAARRGFELGMLFTHSPTDGIYARNGWREIRDRQVVRVEEGAEIEIPPDNIRMYYPLTGRALPAGNIHLLGDKW
jgi:nodulation protein A